MISLKLLRLKKLATFKIMKHNIPKDLKKKFMKECFHKLILEDIKKHGKPMHSVASCYDAIEWMLNEGYTKEGI